MSKTFVTAFVHLC